MMDIPASVSAEQAAGAYFHVPFCSALCHYCDFAKTANFDGQVTQRYFTTLAADLRRWLELPGMKASLRQRLVSVYFGGGTPGLFDSEFAPLLEQLPLPSPEYLHREPGRFEITMEANPDDIAPQRLNSWKNLGINRISLGIQTFDDAGLRFLKRSHDGDRSWQALVQTIEIFDRVSADLIYGWPGQALEMFRRDLQRLVKSGVGHISLYCLTYESGTPIGRARARGRISSQSDDVLADFYDLARAILADAGYLQEEVSNWALPGQECVHNRLYWQDRMWLGLGAGAHGYLPERGPFGTRYAMQGNDRAWIRARTAGPVAGGSLPIPEDSPYGRLPLYDGDMIETERTSAMWLLEYLGSGLRSCYGIDLRRIEARTGLSLALSAAISAALDDGRISISADRILRLAPAEWFRESAWALRLADAFDV